MVRYTSSVCCIAVGGIPVLDTGSVCFCFTAELAAAIGVTAGATAAGILLLQYFSKGSGVKPKVNLDLQKDNPKVVHAFDIEDLGDKAVYCRCWRSKKVG